MAGRKVVFASPTLYSVELLKLIGNASPRFVNHIDHKHRL